MAKANVGTIEPSNSFILASIPKTIIASATPNPIVPRSIPKTDSLLLLLVPPIEAKNPANHIIQKPTYERAAKNQFVEAFKTSTSERILVEFFNPSGFFAIASIPSVNVKRMITGPILLITSTILTAYFHKITE